MFNNNEVPALRDKSLGVPCFFFSHLIVYIAQSQLLHAKSKRDLER